MRTGIKVFSIICLCVAFSAGTHHAGAASSTGLRREKPLLIGLIPEQNIFKQVERYEPLADYLSKKCGIGIKLKVLTRYGNIIRNFVSLGMDGAFFGSFTYALAHIRLGIEVLARPEGFDGTSTYHGLIFVRDDSGIKTIGDMRGKRFAFVDKATTAGYLLPLVYFKKHGIKDYKAYLKETYFTGTHEDAIYDVLNKRADIGAAKNTVYERISNIDSRITHELVILEKSPDVPENGLAVRKSLDDSLKQRLKEGLLSMHDDQRGRDILRHFGARKFIETTDNDYEPVFKYARQINLDLATYDYMNE
ncbi:MAG: phosphate/phosphite/phosphonate ABC transporter substrate-binding protein [Thermodesulfobacteriota bacterium]